MNIEELRRLHAATTQGNWIASQGVLFEGEENLLADFHPATDWLVEATPGDISNAIFAAEAHNIFPALLDEIKRLRNALQEFADCDLNDSNCASLYIASRRIRALAKKALRNSQP